MLLLKLSEQHDILPIISILFVNYQSMANTEQEQQRIGSLRSGCVGCAKLLVFCAGHYWTVDPRLRCLPSLFHEMQNWNAGIKQTGVTPSYGILMLSKHFPQLFSCFPVYSARQSLHLMDCRSHINNSAESR